MTRPSPGGERKIRTLIIDDEPPARTEIRRLLEHEPDVEIIGECSNGAQAITRIRDDAPDLVFLDIQMPEGNGFEVIRTIGADQMPLLVFVTAFEEYAIRAFEAHAIDYLLKPYEDDRFRAALERVRGQIRAGAARNDERLQALEKFLQHSGTSSYPDVFAVRARERYQIVRVDEIRWIQAEGSYVRLHLPDGSRLMRQSISDMEDKLLDPKRFLRIHRSSIVNISKIVSVEPTSRTECDVILDDGTSVSCSRGYRNLLRERVFFSG